MSKINEKQVASAIAIVFLVVLIAKIKAQLFLIDLHRFFFWVDEILIHVSILGFVIGAVWLIFAKPWEREELYWVMGISVVLFIFSFSTIGLAYQGGYSDETISKKAELENQLVAYNLMLSIFTGTFEAKIRGMVIDELDNALCESVPDMDCGEVIENYNAYEKLIGQKKVADKAIKVWR